MRNQLNPYFRFSDENAVEFQFLVQASDTSEWLCAVYFKYIAVSVIEFLIPVPLSVIHCYLSRGDLNPDYFYRPAKYVYAIEIICCD